MTTATATTAPDSVTVPAPAGGQTPRLLRAACVRRPHGVRGELRVEPLGGDALRFTPGLRLRREGGAEYTVRGARDAGGGDVLLALDEVRSRDDAETLRGAYLCVAAEDRRRLADDEWFVWQLVGLRAVTPEGEELGTVADVEDYPEHQVLVVRDARGRESRLPMAAAFVAAVDVAGGSVTVTPWAEEEG